MNIGMGEEARVIKYQKLRKIRFIRTYTVGSPLDHVDLPLESVGLPSERVGLPSKNACLPMEHADRIDFPLKRVVLQFKPWVFTRRIIACILCSSYVFRYAYSLFLHGPTFTARLSA